MSTQSKMVKIEELVSVKSCPFCGSINAVAIHTDVEVMERFDEEIRGYFVVCSFNKNGCGGAGGFGKSQYEAVQKWNRRD